MHDGGREKPYAFEDFKLWLSEVKPIKVSKSRLTKNTQNKVIKALNLFMSWAFKTNVVTEPQPKCEVYAKDELPRVQPEDLFDEQEIEKVRRELRSIRPVSEMLFTILVRSGLRINEALGLCPQFIVEGKIDGLQSRRIHAKLEMYGIGKYFGYIVLMNQPELDSIRTEATFKSPVTERTWERGQVPRKPLKHRKGSEDLPEDWRFIPIYDKSAWNILVDAWNDANSQMDEQIHGKHPQDYLLFEGVTASMFYIDLQKAMKAAGLRFRSPHKCRHTFLSWFYAETDNDNFLSLKVAGHKDQGSREVYSHLNQQIGQEQNFLAQKKRRMSRV